MDDVQRIGRVGAALTLTLVALAGCASSSGGTPAQASPAASVAASPLPAVASAPASADASPDTSVWAMDGHGLSATLPAGWTAGATGIARNEDQPGEIGIGLSEPVTHVYADACRSEGRLEPVGSSADDLVKALDAQASTDAIVSSPSLNGLAWKRVDLAQAPGLDRATCRHGAGGPLQFWADSEENGYYALAPDTIGTVLTTEVDGDRVVVVSTIDGRATSADRAALEDVIASLEVVG